jgi:hypothetical protein
MCKVLARPACACCAWVWKRRRESTVYGMSKIALGFAVPVAASIACAPLAQADGDASNLDQLVIKVYNQLIPECSRHRAEPNVQRIDWDGGRPTGQGGSGRIVDVNPLLGGPFTAYWNPGPTPTPKALAVQALNQGYWDITVGICT